MLADDYISTKPLFLLFSPKLQSYQRSHNYTSAEVSSSQGVQTSWLPGGGFTRVHLLFIPLPLWHLLVQNLPFFLHEQVPLFAQSVFVHSHDCSLTDPLTNCPFLLSTRNVSSFQFFKQLSCSLLRMPPTKDITLYLRVLYT